MHFHIGVYFGAEEITFVAVLNREFSLQDNCRLHYYSNMPTVQEEDYHEEQGEVEA